MNQANHRLFVDKFTRRVTTTLSAGARDLHPDITERLRVAREQAVSRRHVVVLQNSTSVQMNTGSATLSMHGDWRTRLTSLLPLVALIFGLITISVLVDEQRAHELADVDAELLADELPPDAYIDPGFAKFLQISGRE